MTLASALAVERSGDGYTTEIDASWVYDGRVFGGYVVALAGTVAGHEAEQPMLRRLHAMFPTIAKPRTTVFEVATFRRGRSASPVHVVARQGAHVVASVHLWFVRPDLYAGGSSDGAAHAPPPDRCDPLPWVTGFAPFMRFFEERALDYPRALEEFCDGGRRVELWARLTPPDTAAPALRAQMFDAMLLDAHLFDPIARRRGTDASVASLDLSVTWLMAPGAEDWTRLAAAADVDGSLTTATATLWSETGTRRATATSQGMVARALQRA